MSARKPSLPLGVVPPPTYSPSWESLGKTQLYASCLPPPLTPSTGYPLLLNVAQCCDGLCPSPALLTSLRTVMAVRRLVPSTSGFEVQ